jgi:hypothetical protein
MTHSRIPTSKDTAITDKSTWHVCQSAQAAVPRRSGFALVLALSLMAFVLLLILSMSTLVQVETASSAARVELVQARQAALVGLQVALGELQEHAGADRRMTSSAGIIEGSARLSGTLHNPHWTGVWKNAGTASTVPGASTFTPQLLTWLVSGNAGVDAPAGVSDATVAFGPESDLSRNVEHLRPAGADTSVTVVGAGSAQLYVGDDDGDGIQDGGGVAVPLVEIHGDGYAAVNRYAYWVGDEGIKARSNLRDPLAGAVAASDAGRVRLSVPGRSAPEIFSREASGAASPTLWGTDFLVNSDTSERMVFTGDMVYLLGTDDATSGLLVNERFHDMSLWSHGLLTDAKSGGLKYDLTTATRFSDPDWSDFKDEINTGEVDLIFPSNAGSASPADPGGPGWDVLRSFVQDSFSGSSSQLTPRIHDPDTHGYAPIVQEFKMFIALSVQGVGAARSVRLHYMPVVTLWNPYDHTLTAQDYYMAFGSLYPTLQVHVGLDPTHWAETGGAPDLSATMGYNIGTHRKDPPEITADRAYRFRVACPDIPPGRAIVFSPPDGGRAMALSSNLPTTSAPFNLLSPGWRDGSNYYIDLPSFTGGSLQPTDDIFHLSMSGGSGVYSDLRVGLSPTGVSEDPLMVIHNILFWYLHDSSSSGGFQHMNASRYTRVSLSGSTGNPLDNNLFTDTTGNYLTSDYEPILGYWMQLRMSEQVLAERNNLPHPWMKSYNPRGPFYGESLIEARSNGQAPRGYSNLPGYYKLLALDNFSSLYNVNSNGEYTFPGYSAGSLSGESAVLFRAFEDDDEFLSVGDLMHANLVPDAGSALNNMGYLNYGSNYPAYAVGSSSQSPYIEADSTSPYRTIWPSGTDNIFFGGENLVFYDLPYLMNEALWDRFYFSSIDSTGAAVVNSRFAAASASSFSNYDELDSQSFAARFSVSGAFNVNSTSVDAWASVLGAFLGVDSAAESVDVSEALLNRVSFPQGEAFEAGQTADEEAAWSGSRKLTAQEIRELATAIVAEVKLRGPFLSLSDFINRDIHAATGAAVRSHGLLDAAIQSSGINSSLSTSVGSSRMVLDASDFADLESYNGGYFGFGNYNLEALLEPIVENIPGSLSQPDLLAKFGSLLTVRSDTFTIRVYGDSLDDISGKPTARVWGEAVVQRCVEPVQASSEYLNEPDATTADTYGRRFKVVSFRWLKPDEV